MEEKAVALNAVDKITVLRSVLNVIQVACNNRLEIDPEGVAMLLGLLDDYYIEDYLQELQDIIDDS